MNREILKQRRKSNNLIITDDEGNLMGYNPKKVSGKKQRLDAFKGRFFKKELEENDNNTYARYHFGAELETRDKKAGKNS